MTLREVFTGKMANKGFAVVPGEFTDRMTFAGMGNGLQATVLLPVQEPDADAVDTVADVLVSDILRQIKSL